jgi:hypothetical protein
MNWLKEVKKIRHIKFEPKGKVCIYFENKDGFRWCGVFLINPLRYFIRPKLIRIWNYIGIRLLHARLEHARRLVA